MAWLKTSRRLYVIQTTAEGAPDSENEGNPLEDAACGQSLAIFSFPSATNQCQGLHLPLGLM